MTQTDSEAAWGALLERLSAQRASLVDHFLELLDEQGYYSNIDVGSEDLWSNADTTLEMLILQIAGAEVPERLRGLPERLGRRRAQQGVEREALLEAVRLDFRVIWGGLVRAQDDAPADLLVAHAEEVLTVVETYVGDVQIAYLREVDALGRDSRTESRRAFARLLSTDAPADELAAEVAPALGMPVDGLFAVMCVIDVDELRVGVDDAVVEWQVDEGLVLLRLDGDDASFDPGLRDPGLRDESLRGSVVRRVHGLAAVPDAAIRARRLARLADEVAPAGGAGGLITVADAELAIARRLLEAELPGIGNPVMSAFAELDEGEATRLIATARAFCATGSVKVTAERTFVHRNTVVNRLAQFRRLTGFDLGVPDEAARALLWLA
ncbi:helix-turn-helix domain-containing protein [Agrococcus casei]|uniref:helix-turn-helix domain-containing protein n=2 Tax=Agrococcus casei TaxID=343512 RepID=UPI003F93DAB5